MDQAREAELEPCGLKPWEKICAEQKGWDPQYYIEKRDSSTGDDREKWLKTELGCKETYFKEQIEITKNDDKFVAECYIELARIFAQLKFHGTAVIRYQHALDTHKDIFTPVIFREFLEVLKKAADCYGQYGIDYEKSCDLTEKDKAKGCFVESKGYRERYRDIKIGMTGEQATVQDSYDLAECYIGLARTCAQLGSPMAAEIQYQRALHTHKDVFTPTIYKEFSQVLRKAGTQCWGWGVKEFKKTPYNCTPHQYTAEATQWFRYSAEYRQKYLVVMVETIGERATLMDLLDLANALYNAGKYNDALSYFAQAADVKDLQFPLKLRLHTNMAECHHQLGNCPAALIEYDASIENQESWTIIDRDRYNDCKPKVWYGHDYAVLKASSIDAANTVATVMTANCKSPEEALNKGEMYWEAAIVEWKKEGEPNSPEKYTKKCLDLFSHAAAYLKAYLSIERSDQTFKNYCLLGDALYNSKNYNDALSCYAQVGDLATKAQENFPPKLCLHGTIAECHFHLKNYAAALQPYERTFETQERSY